MSELEERALPIPPDLEAMAVSEFTQELVRAWWDGEQIRNVVRPAFNDYHVVGAMLAELSYHFSNAYAMQNGLDRREVLAGIRQRWDEVQQSGVLENLFVTRALDETAG